MPRDWIKRAALVAAVLFAIVAWHEWRYAQDHPHAYGPANYIVLAAIGGVVLAAAVFSLAVELVRLDQLFNADHASSKAADLERVAQDPGSEEESGPKVVVLPQLGSGMERGTIVKWLKSEGERVEKGEPLYELDTDKVTQEVEAETSGIVLHILVQSGEVAVGSALAVIGKGRG
jgi:biotin carboxyl carrier protein